MVPKYTIMFELLNIKTQKAIIPLLLSIIICFQSSSMSNYLHDWAPDSTEWILGILWIDIFYVVEICINSCSSNSTI